MLICLGSILLVDMRSIGTSHVRIRYVKYVTSARTYESAESTHLINCSGLMIRYGGSIREDSCGDEPCEDSICKIRDISTDL